MRATLALALKDLRLLLRVRSALFFTFGWPLIVAVMFGMIFGGGGKSAKMAVAVVDLDGTDASRAFAADLGGLAELKVEPLAQAEAEARVRKGSLTAAVVLPPGFGAASERVFHGEPAKALLWIDPSRKAERAMLEGMLFKVAAENLNRVFTDPAVSRKTVEAARRDLAGAKPEDREPLLRLLDDVDAVAARNAAAAASAPGSAPAAEKAGGWQPILVETTEMKQDRDGPQNAFSVTFPQGILWGIIGCVMSFATSLVVERTRGTLMRLQCGPMSRAQILAGKALSCGFAIFAVVALLLAVARLGFGVRPGSWPLLALATACAAAGFTGLMMAISSLGKTEQAVSGAGWAALMPMAMIGGGTIPLFAMPAWLVPISRFSPFRWAIYAVEGALWRGFTLREMLPHCLLLLGLGAAGFLVGTRALKAEG